MEEKKKSLTLYQWLLCLLGTLTVVGWFLEKNFDATVITLLYLILMAILSRVKN